MKNLTEAQKVVVALKIAKDLNLNHYTREVSARDVNGDPVSPESSKACSWCAHGATTKAALYVGLDPDDLSWYLEAGTSGKRVAELNDSRRDKLPALWDRAIALAESEAQ